MTFRENESMLRQIRRQAVTDALTGLGNRRSLVTDLERALDGPEGAPERILVIFDLNGFKRYNDTFGHPAGDELLARLGRRLRAAIGEDGAAYRIGGDEFCAVVTGSGETVGAVTKRAAQALTESDRGVEVSSSWGVAAIPDEAATPSEAMQLADVRMYAQKESRRLAHPAVPPLPEASEVSEAEAVER